MACDVYDYVFKGFSQPILGTLSIPIGDILQAQKKEREDEIKESDYFVKELKKII